MHGTIFGNTRNPLCKTEKPASMAGFPSLPTQKTAQIKSSPEASLIPLRPQDAEAVQSLWTPVRVVDNRAWAIHSRRPVQAVMMAKRQALPAPPNPIPKGLKP